MLNIINKINTTSSFGAVIVPRHELIKNQPEMYKLAAYASHERKPVKINNIPDVFMVETGDEKAHIKDEKQDLTDYFIFKSSSIEHKSRHEFLLSRFLSNNSVPAQIVNDDEIADMNNFDYKILKKRQPKINIVV